ncbi:MAG: hypothetical protein KDA44_23030 [Planctomycetales bacterium]|nr:hypothetical protein [Planctomycetales bacterium]
MKIQQYCATGVLLTMLAAVTSLAAEAGAGSQRSVVTQGPVAITVSVDKELAQVADPVQFVLEVTAPRGTRVELPRLPEQLGDFEVHGRELVRDVPAADNASDRQWTLKATLETLKTGRLEIPSLDVHVAADGNATAFDTIRSKPIAVQVASVLEDRADPAKFRDIKDTVDMAVPDDASSSWLAWTLGGSGAAVASALAAVLIARRKRGPTPAAWALGQIDDLEQLLADESADPELVYNELVDVVREFFELQYEVPTRTRTSPEFLTEAANTVQLGEAPRQRLASLVSVADDIKFACYGVGNQQSEQAFADARAFVLECDQHCEAVEEERDVP